MQKPIFTPSNQISPHRIYVNTRIETKTPDHKIHISLSQTHISRLNPDQSLESPSSPKIEKRIVLIEKQIEGQKWCNPKRSPNNPDALWMEAPLRVNPRCFSFTSTSKSSLKTQQLNRKAVKAPHMTQRLGLTMHWFGPFSALARQCFIFVFLSLTLMGRWQWLVFCILFLHLYKSNAASFD